MALDDGQILEWAIGKIKTEYKDDVALLIGHGFAKEASQLPGDKERYKGEIDYYVADTPRADGLSKSFIVDGVCYDIYPRSWSGVEMMAELNDCHTACLADANILYVRSEEDRAHFERIRSKLFANLQNRSVSMQKASARLTMAEEIYKGMLFKERLFEVRSSAGYILDYLAQSVALANGRYFKRNELFQLEEMQTFTSMPDDFPRLYEEIIRSESVEQIKTLCYRLIRLINAFLDQKLPSAPPPRRVRADYRGLADWYQEFGHMWRKIYDDCRKNDERRAFIRGCALQHELDVISEEFGLREMDLLGSYDAENLSGMEKRAKEIEEYIVDSIVNNSVRIAIYPSVEAFLKDN